MSNVIVKNVMVDVQEILLAGSDSSSNTVEWAIAKLICHLIKDYEEAPSQD